MVYLKLLYLKNSIRIRQRKKVFRKCNYDLSITNLGELDIPIKADSLTIKNIFGPLINARRNEKILGVMTMNDKMSFSFVWKKYLMPYKDGMLIKKKAMNTLISEIDKI